MTRKKLRATISTTKGLHYGNKERVAFEAGSISLRSIFLLRLTSDRLLVWVLYEAIHPGAGRARVRASDSESKERARSGESEKREKEKGPVFYHRLTGV